MFDGRLYFPCQFLLEWHFLRFLWRSALLDCCWVPVACRVQLDSLGNQLSQCTRWLHLFNKYYNALLRYKNNFTFSFCLTKLINFTTFVVKTGGHIEAQETDASPQSQGASSVNVPNNVQQCLQVFKFHRHCYQGTWSECGNMTSRKITNTNISISIAINI